MLLTKYTTPPDNSISTCHPLPQPQKNLHYFSPTRAHIYKDKDIQFVVPILGGIYCEKISVLAVDTLPSNVGAFACLLLHKQNGRSFQTRQQLLFDMRLRRKNAYR